MKAYPIILIPETTGGFTVYIPDFECNTQGTDLADAMFMARDCIGMMGITYEDESKEIPEPSLLENVSAKPGETKTLVDVDFVEYRKRNEKKTIRKNVSLPSWLAWKAEKAGINCSKTLQEALKDQLGL